MPRAIVADLISRYNTLKGERGNFDSLFQELSEYILPRKSNITKKTYPGTKQMGNVYDSTAIQANTLLASAMHSVLTSTSIRWFSPVFGIGNHDLMDDDEVREWLEDCRERMFDALRASNFESEIHEVYYDIGAFGTGCLRMEARPWIRDIFPGVVFEAKDISEYVVGESYEGVVDEVYTMKMLSPKQIETKYDLSEAPKVREKLLKQGHDKISIVCATYPRTYYDNRMIDKLNMPYASVHFCHETQEILRESGYWYFPYMVPRWAKTAGEVYGRSPGMTALPDVKSLNEVVKQGLRALAKAIDPPIITDDESVLGQLMMKPNAINVTRPNARLEYLKSEARLDYESLKKAEFQDTIRKTFFSDRLTLPAFRGQPMTATEVQERVDEMNRIIGPTISRLRSELHAPLVRNLFNIMLRGGAFIPPPGAVMERFFQRGIDIIDVDFIGPIARAQKFADAIAIKSWLAEMLPLAQVNPEIMDKVDWDQTIAISADRLAVPEKAVRNQKDVVAIRTARANQVQEQAANEQALQASEAMRNVAPYIKATVPNE